MTQLHPSEPLPILTLAGVIDRIQASEDLPRTRRRDLLSAVRCVSRLSGLPASDIRVDIPELRRSLKAIHPVQARISSSRLSNIKADFRAALETVGAIPAPLAERPLSERWTTFLALDDKGNRLSFLGRLSRFCASTGREPEDVDEAVMAEFHAYLDARLLASDPASICRHARYKFNALIRENGLPIPPLTTRKGGHRNRPLETYPEAFRADLAELIARRLTPDPFDETGVSRPHSPITLRNIQARVRQALDAAVAAGWAPERFESLADVVRPEIVRDAFREMKRRGGDRYLKTHHEIACTLLAIARHHVKAPPEDIAKIVNLKTNLASHLGLKHRVMGDRPKRQLAQFLHDPANVELLLGLSQRLTAGLRDAPDTRRAALVAMRAAAIAILLSCPLRIKNLSALELGTHIWPIEVKGRRRYQLHIPASEVKNRVPMEAVLGKSTTRILDLYLDRYRKLITPEPSSALFPTQAGLKRAPGTFGEDLSRTVWQATGLKMTPHLFRHFAAFLFLTEHPGEYETVRRILGHTKLETTVSFYAPLCTSAALDRYGVILEKHWKGK